MKIFFGVSYSNEVDSEGHVSGEYRQKLEEMIELVRGLGHTVSCAPEYDGWEINNLSAAEAYRTDTGELDTSDAFIGFIDSAQPSTGVCMETMRAAMQSKRLLVITDNENPVYMIRGMVDSEYFASHAVCPDQPSRLLALEAFLNDV